MILSSGNLGIQRASNVSLASWLFVLMLLCNVILLVNRTMQHFLILRETGLQDYVEGRGGSDETGKGDRVTEFALFFTQSSV